MQHFFDPLRHGLETLTERSWHYHGELEKSLPHRSSNPSEGRPRVLNAPAPPWNSGCAYLIMELHSTSRSLEREMREHIICTERPARGGSDGNTAAALRSIARLSYGVPDEVVRGAAAALGSWIARSEVALGLLSPLRRIPASPVGEEPRCPYCGFRTLRLLTATGAVHCVNLQCFVGDPNDNVRPRGSAEIDAANSLIKIMWEDGNVS